MNYTSKSLGQLTKQKHTVRVMVANCYGARRQSHFAIALLVALIPVLFAPVLLVSVAALPWKFVVQPFHMRNLFGYFDCRLETQFAGSHFVVDSQVAV